MLQAIAHLIQILNKQYKLVVQPTGALGDFTGILPLALLLPEAVDHPQGGQQRSRADDHDMPVKRLLKQIRLGLQCRRKGRLDRYEQQHEIQAMQPFQTLVVLAGEPLHMIAQRQHVLLERGLADHIVIGTDILLIRRQADLGVDHYLFVTRQHDQYVGLEALAIGALEADLGLVFAALLQARVLKHPLQNQFAPVALGFLAFEGTGQVGRLITQAQVQLLQALQLFTEGETLA